MNYAYKEFKLGWIELVKNVSEKWVSTIAICLFIYLLLGLDGRVRHLNLNINSDQTWVCALDNEEFKVEHG